MSISLKAKEQQVYPKLFLDDWAPNSTPVFQLMLKELFLFPQKLSSIDGQKTKRLRFVLNLCPDRNAKNLENPQFLYYTLLLTKKYFY